MFQFALSYDYDHDYIFSSEIIYSFQTRLVVTILSSKRQAETYTTLAVYRVKKKIITFKNWY